MSPRIPPEGCPKCHSAEVEAERPDTTGDFHALMQECRCVKCGIKWFEYFHYTTWATWETET